MKHTVDKMKEIRGFIIGFKKSIEYKFLYIQWTLYDIATIVIYISIFFFFFKSRETMFYILYFLILIYGSFLPTWKTKEIIDDIKKGDLTQLLTKPFNYLLFRFFYFVGLDIRVFFIIGIVLIPFIFSYTLNAIFFMLYLILAYILEFLFIMSFVLLSFWIYEPKHLLNILNNIKLFLRGSFLPYTFFPEETRMFFDFLPFAYFGYLKFEVLMNGLNIIDKDFILGYIGNVVLFGLILYFIWKVGLKKFESQGG